MNVDNKIIERLLADKALGELSEDVSILLDAVIAENPGAMDELNSNCEVVSLAKRALDREGERWRLHLPPLSVKADPRRVWRRAGLCGALAACAMIGLCVGLYLSSGQARPQDVAWQPPKAAPPGSIASMESTANVQDMPPTASSSQFWSISNLMQNTKTAGEDRPQRRLPQTGLWELEKRVTR